MTYFGTSIAELGAVPLSYELGPIRPPSEAHSLLIRATRNCPWNKCEFCPTYKGKKFELRAVEEIKRDIETVKAISEKIKEFAWRIGYGGNIKQVAAMIYNNPPNESFMNVALWTYFGGKTVFLQDANTIVMRTNELVEVIKFLKETLPTLTRITSYGRSKTAAKKSLEELKELHDAGLSRLHIGLESGDDEVLKLIHKGVTGKEHIEGGRKVVESGISLCEYVMPGVGGKQRSKEHAVKTARVLNEINPDFIRLRSLVLREDMLLNKKKESGEFELLEENEVVEEIKEFLERLKVSSYLKRDHIANLLPEIEGQLPQDKEKMLTTINEYLSLPSEEKLNFRLGRRIGYYESLNELRNSQKHKEVENVIENIKLRDGDIEETIANLKKRFI
jgi:histone acetyltransferase (RNA polymerase elongator complex component)